MNAAPYPLQQQQQQQRGRKKLGEGGGAPAAGAAGSVERIRHHNGAHVFYLYMTAELGILCVTDGIPVDQEV